MAGTLSVVHRGGLLGLATTMTSVVLLVGACGDDGDGASDVDRAKARVEAKQEALTDATAAAEEAAAVFCDAGASYLAALDRYGDVLLATPATVGDVRDAGSDLAEPEEDVLGAGEDAAAAWRTRCTVA